MPRAKDILRCPCCGGQIKDAKLKVSLEFNTIICGDKAIEVTPTQAEIIFVLKKNFPDFVPRERLILAVWGQAGIDDNVLRTMIYGTRKVLLQIGYTISASTGNGYRLVQPGQPREHTAK